MKKLLKMEILNEKKKIERIYGEKEDQQYILLELLELLWGKYVNKSNNVSRVNYRYNYSDNQTITFILNNKYKYVFHNIPTKWGSISSSEILEILNKEEK